jgi:hypothetical protein
MVLLVQPHPQSNTTYVVDTGFAGGGPLRPILLSDRPEDAVFGALPGEWNRVVRAAYPDSSLGTSPLAPGHCRLVDTDPFTETAPGTSTPPLHDWHMQVLRAPFPANTPVPRTLTLTALSPRPALPPPPSDAAWRTLYTFSTAEIFMTDILAASHGVSRREAVFRDSVLAMRCVEVDAAGATVASDAMAPEKTLLSTGGDVVVPLRWQGKSVLTADGTMLRRYSRVTQHGDEGETTTLWSESERVDLLRTLFRAPLEEGCERWIEGRTASLAMQQQK